MTTSAQTAPATPRLPQKIPCERSRFQLKAATQSNANLFNWEVSLRKTKTVTQFGFHRDSSNHSISPSDREVIFFQACYYRGIFKPWMLGW